MIEERVSKLEQIADQNHEMLDRMNKTIWGNGQKGLVTVTEMHANVLRVMTWLLGTVTVTLITTGMKSMWDYFVIHIH